MSIFIFISILLHIASLYFIFILWKKGEQIKTSSLNGQEMQDIEILLEEFSVEMKDENEKLKQLILKYQYESNLKQNDETEPITNNDSDSSSILQNEKIDEDKDKKEVIILSKQGFSSTEIAKKLNRGKGEIELLLRFYG
ncbi:DUF6115 domain-containing protein [Bacillus sp. NEB1478]|uniref:DUF6115 domain-containing protein n=1 Tax=Bacillus sp. NEB1478 TaxID=3073816 RepID=UPI00287387A3|nr:hypothetical protein [Bacillus sp. NEB1478]WNB90375.1 hypothetical protein RGB74_10605 [Bacillus sp. NEB1478]